MAVEAQPVHHAAGTERQGVTGLVDNSHEGIGAGDPRQPVLGAVAAVHKVGQIALGRKKSSANGVERNFPPPKEPREHKHHSCK